MVNAPHRLLEGCGFDPRLWLRNHFLRVQLDEHSPIQDISKLPHLSKYISHVIHISSLFNIICLFQDEAFACQWQSAEFGDTAQKEKFLRLMGAYKTSNKKSTTSNYSVMAMNKQQEQRLSNSLEKQFLQAMQTRKEKGFGLGYQ